MNRAEIMEFIRNNRKEIDSRIRSNNLRTKKSRIKDSDRFLLILFAKRLYDWAQSMGVNV